MYGDRKVKKHKERRVSKTAEKIKNVEKVQISTETKMEKRCTYLE